MTITTTQAIQQVLADGPMKASEIAEKVLALVPTLGGKTPLATVTSRLYKESKVSDGLVVKVEGEKSTFQINPTAATQRRARSAKTSTIVKTVEIGPAEPVVKVSAVKPSGNLASGDPNAIDNEIAKREAAREAKKAAKANVVGVAVDVTPDPKPAKRTPRKPKAKTAA